MTLDDEEDGRAGNAPIDMLEAYFGAHGWSCDRMGDDEVAATVQGSWAQYELRGIWRGEDRVLQFLALPDVRVPAEKRGAVYEALGLINEQLWLGHFELWAASGIALYRNAMLIDGDAGLALEQAETLIETAIEECDRFYPVFQFVLWGDKSPADAIAAAMIETHGEA
jgi:hypothetical protein